MSDSLILTDKSCDGLFLELLTGLDRTVSDRTIADGVRGMTGQTLISDEDLLNSMLDGNEEAFVTLYRRRQSAVYRFAFQMCGTEATAEDVTQEVFLALLRSGRSFDPQRGNLLSFLYGIARNQVLRRFERDRRLASVSDDDDADGQNLLDRLPDQDSPLTNLAKLELIEQVRQAILALPAHYREVVVLCELHEMSYVETADVIGCAVGTVRSRLHRARGMLVDKLRYRADVEPRPAITGAMRGGI